MEDPLPDAGVRSGSSVPAQLGEEVVDDVEVAGAQHLVVDVLADREVQHAKTERGEDDRLSRRDRHPALDNVGEGPEEEVPAAGQLLGEVRRGLRLEAVLDV